ncbi:MAG: FAD-dependent oxidoreductase [Myxococcaceae bacterium]
MGAGITGLSAAYFLKDKLSVKVLEASGQVGGVIQTQSQGRFVLEQGPDCFMNQKPWGLELALELGLQSELIESKDFQRRVFVLRNGSFETSDHEDKAVAEFLGNRARVGVNPNAFLTFKKGMQTWPKALWDNLGDRVILGAKAVSMDVAQKIITCESGLQIQAKNILLTLPAHESAKLLGLSWPHFKTTQTACVHLAYPRNAVEHPLDAFGLIIPASENRKISAMTFVSSKFDHRCPEDFVLIRVFLKGEFSDARLEVQDLLKPKCAPVLEAGYRLTYADPKYSSDHEAQVLAIEKDLPEGIFLAGSPYRGVGISDCVYQARQVSDMIGVHGCSLLIPAS